MALHPPHEKEQIKAIDITLATAPKVKQDLKEKFGYGENEFFYLDLIEYRINNKLEDIAEKLAIERGQTVEERYGLINDQPRVSVGSAFRGYNGEHFPDYQFNGLLGKETNDMIEEIRYEKNGLKTADMINPETEERYVVEAGRIGGRKLASMINPETEERYVVEAGRKGNEAQGNHMWSLEEIVDIGELKYGEGLTWNDTTSEMNEKYDKNWTTSKIRDAYRNNKHRLTDEEE